MGLAFAVIIYFEDFFSIDRRLLKYLLNLQLILQTRKQRQPRRVNISCWWSNIHRKGVIEILSLVFKLGRLKLCEDNLTMAPTSVAIPTPERDFVYAHGVGLSSYLHSR